MRDHTLNSATAPLSAFAIGALAGAAVALLLAPADGRSTRRYLGRRAEAGKQRVVGAIDQGRELARRQTARLSSAASKGSEQLAEASEHVVAAKNKVAGAAREGNSAIRDVARDVREQVGPSAK